MDTTPFKLIWKLRWPFVVLVAFNLENWATESGYGSLFSSRIEGRPVLGAVFDALTGPLITHLLAFVTGMMIFVWLVYREELAMGKHGGPSDKKVRESAKHAAVVLGRDTNWFLWASFESEIANFNRIFSMRGLPEIPTSEVVEQGPMRDAYKNYHLLLAADETIRRDPASAASHLEALKGIAAQRQLRLDTAPETQP